MSAPDAPFPHPHGIHYSPKRWEGLFGIGVGVFMFTLDTSSANVALPTLVKAFDTTLAAVQWVVLAYLLVLTALVLGAARVGERLGRKRAYLMGLGIFCAGAVAASLAPAIGWLIAARALQGLGAVFVSALGGAIVAQTFPPTERGRALGVIASVVLAGVALGPTVGGLMLGWFGWRGVFLQSVPVGLLAMLVVARVIPHLPPTPPRGRFDWAGAITLAASLVAFALGLTRAQSEGFASVQVLGMLAMAAGGVAAFVAIESRVANPVVNLHTLRRESIGLGLALGMLVFMTLGAVTLLLPFYLQGILNYPPAKVGLLMAVAPAVGMVMAPVAGTLADRMGPRRVTFAALLVLTAGCASLATLRPEGGEWGYVLHVIPFGLATGLFTSANNSAVLNAARPEEIGIVAGLVSLARTLGQSTGVPLGAAVFALFALGHATHGDARALLALPTDALMRGMHWTFGAATVLAAAGTVVATRLLKVERAGPSVVVEDRKTSE
ncbi:MAG: MFS transporter [Burkholderiales bacterium]|jgi:EmrB/QacA subfamily drug resistance transporter|nr:MFS transporter [Burkholderiales bacterium]